MLIPIYEKTDKGRKEIEGRVYGLSAKGRRVLILVDAQKTEVDLSVAAGVGKEIQPLLKLLLDGGFIAPRDAPVSYTHLDVYKRQVHRQGACVAAAGYHPHRGGRWAMNGNVMVRGATVLLITLNLGILGCASSADDVPVRQVIQDANLVDKNYAAADALLARAPWLKERRDPCLLYTSRCV